MARSLLLVRGVNTKHLTLLTACLLTAAGCNGSEPAEMSDESGIEVDYEEEVADDVEEDVDESDSDSDGGADFPDCGGDRIELDRMPPNVMLVLDKSGSMTNPDNNWDHDNDSNTPDVSRWTSLYDTVDNLLTQYDDSVNFGAVLFPAKDADSDGGDAEAACLMQDDVEVSLAASNRTAILGTIPGRTEDTAGGTPARFGIINAVDHLTDITAEGPRAMVLVTDGEANCIPGLDEFWSQYDEELETAVGSAFADNGIPTYVVGIDIDDEELSGDDGRTLRQAMNDIAVVGGVPRDGEERFYNVSDHTALQSALDEIAARVSCTLSLEHGPKDPDGVVLTIDGEEFERVETCGDADGWRFTSDAAPFNTIELCGNTCGAFIDAGVVETDYVCPIAG